jgi:DNA invertase Pin-like site-specific DNA recombinase
MENAMTNPTPNAVKTAALYARISTLDKGQDPMVQLAPMREHAARQGWTVIEYVDRGISGAKESRPELNRLMTDAQAGAFQIVMVARFDRFARSASHLLRGLETFTAAGISFVSSTEGIDTSTLAGKMVFTVLGAVAEMERGLIAERVKAGMKNAKAKGAKLGRPGIDIDPHKVRELRAQGLTLRAIGAQLGVSVTVITDRLSEAA